MSNLAIVVLAAGLGKRMGGKIPKVLARARGKALIEQVLQTAQALEPERSVIVTGHGRELVEETLKVSDCVDAKKIKFALQADQKGTGDAVKCALPELAGFVGPVLILYGDVPLLRKDTLEFLVNTHRSENATLTLLVLETDKDNAYGRVIRDSSKKYIERIVEKRDCGPGEASVREFNAGVYVVDSAFLKPAIEELRNENAQKEYYLTDIVERAAKEGQIVVGCVTTDFEEVQGVNTRIDLQEIKKVLLMRKVLALAEAGVEIEDLSSLYVDDSVEVAATAVIGPNVQLKGNSKIGARVKIEGSAYIDNSIIEDDAYIKFGVRIEGSVVGAKSQVGPFAHLRPGSVLKEEVKVGNFVETKKSTLEKGVHASHLTYLGDATVGEGTNIGAGTITCNYDGINKWTTTIGKNVFIGSNSALVAPVTIKDSATIGAGSVITKDVEAGALAITRAPQLSRLGYSRGRPRKS